MKLEKLFDRPVAFHRVFVGLGAGVTGALLLSQAIYWSKRSADDGGWFFKTAADWEEETGMTRREQETARKRLRSAGFIHEELRGVPATLYFRVDFDAILEAVRLADSAKQDATKAQNQFSQKRQTRSAKSAKPCATKAPNKSGGKRQPLIKKDYNRDYTETTTESIPGGDEPAPEPMVIHAPNGEVYEIPGELRYPGPGTESHKAWVAYAIAYWKRYGSWPLWNGTVAGQLGNFIRRVGQDAAPRVAVHYVRQVNEQFVVQLMHPVRLLQMDAEKWATQAQTGQVVTRTQAQQADRTQSNLNAAMTAGDKAREILAQRQREAAEAAQIGRGDANAQ